jgi:hypothetical protein
MPVKEPTHSLRLFVGDMAQDYFLISCLYIAPHSESFMTSSVHFNSIMSRVIAEYICLGTYERSLDLG